MKILGIDYGLKNLGFALAETPLATPHSVAHVDSLTAAIDRSIRVIEAVKPDLVVVGIPEGEIATAVTQFVNALSPLLKVNVVTHPEAFSSHDAITKLRAGGASKKKLTLDHAYAAVLILEDYLESNPTLIKI